MRKKRALASAVLVAAIVSSPFMGAVSQQTRSVSGSGTATIVGRGVIDAIGEDVGPLVDVLVDKSGVPIAGVIDIGGFFHVGRRRVAVAWRLLHFVPDNGERVIHMDMTFDSASAAPEFRGPDNSLIVIDAAPP